MKYFLRNSDDGAITGPFELDDIEAMFKAGKLPADTLATGDIGESLGQVHRTPAEDWMPLKSIPGFGRERPPSAPLRQAAPPLPAPTPPPPAELFPTHIWKKPQSPPEQISFCPFCRQRADGPVVLGETRCGQCGKLLYPAAGTNRPPTPTPSRPLSLLTFIAAFIGGLVVQHVSLIIVCLFAGLASRKANATPAIIFAILLCAGRIAVALPMLRSPTNRGFAFGILLGVGLTALLTANCAVNGLK
jgi:hypothetical protein